MATNNNNVQKPEAGAALHEALRNVMRPLAYRAPSDPYLGDLPMSQFRCLAVVWHSPGLKMADVAGKLNVKLPALSRVVNRLVTRGMLERESDPQDRRIVRIKLTGKAHGLLAAHFGAREEHLARAASCLSHDELQRVLEALRLLAAAAERAASKQTGSVGASGNELLIERSDYVRL